MSEGEKFQVKLSARASEWVKYLSAKRDIAQSDLIREYFEDRLFLFQLPISIHQRLQARAAAEGIPLTALVADILLAAALKFPPGAPDELVPGHKAPDAPPGIVTSGGRRPSAK